MKFIQGLNHQALNVKDLKRSKQFYEDVLEMTYLYEDATHVFLKVGDGPGFGIVALLAQPASGPEMLDPALRQGSAYNHFGFRASSVEQVYAFAEHLKKHGVKILKGPYTRKDGASVYFADPDGYTLEYLFLTPDPKAYVS